MIHKDSGLVSSGARTWRIDCSFAPSLLLIFFFFPLFPSPFLLSSPFLFSLTRCAGIELLTVELECISSQMLGGPSRSPTPSLLAVTPSACLSARLNYSPFSSPRSHYFLHLNFFLVYLSFRYFPFSFLSPSYIFPLSSWPFEVVFVCAAWY